MKKTIASGIVALAVLLGLLLTMGQGDTPTPAPAPAMEVTKEPALLVTPAAKVGDLTFYVVKLGDAADKIPNIAAVSTEGVQERTKDIVYAGRDVTFYAFDGKIYRINVHGDLLKQLPTYDATRLQVALGKADDITQSRLGEDTYLSFFGRHVRYTVHHFRMLSVVTEVDLYAP